MIHAFVLALRQAPDPPVVRVFLKSLALTVLIFVLLGVGLWYGLHWATARFWGPDAGTFAGVATAVLMLLAHWLLFRAIAIAVIGIFGDEVVAAVEAKHYPEALAKVRHVPFLLSLRMGLASAARAVVLNIIFLPVYLIANVAAPLVFFVLNAWLLGRDLGEMVAMRHMPADALPAWRRQTRVSRFALGAVATGLLLVPIVNLIAPVLGAAMAAHAFHGGRRT